MPFFSSLFWLFKSIRTLAGIRCLLHSAERLCSRAIVVSQTRMETHNRR
jgi:hypothetical protein